jgi:RND family efflux transporter MFP subunit
LPKPEPRVEREPTTDGTAAKPSKRAGRQWVLMVVAAVVVGAGAWYVHFQRANAGKDAAGHEASANETGQGNGKATLGLASTGQSGADAKKNSAGPRIETVRAEVVPCRDILRLTGSLVADERSSVASNISGIAAEVRVDRGSLVRKGDVLVQIDPADAQNKLAEGEAMLDELKARLGIEENMASFNPEDQPEVRVAKASADLAAANFRRAKDLSAKKVITAEAFDQALTEYELAAQRYRQALLQIRQAYQVCRTAQIKLAILKKAVDDTTIRAPFDGWVAEKLVAVGEQICSGMQATKVVTLVRIDPLRLSLTVPQQDIGRIQPGQTVRFHVDSFPDRTFEAAVRFIAPVVAHDTRSMVVEAVAPNADRALRPGQFATAELELSGRGTGVFVPRGAVQKSGEVARVFVVRDGVAREQVVALGKAERERMEIRSGLTGKEILVARPELVHDGDAVRP